MHIFFEKVQVNKNINTPNLAATKIVWVDCEERRKVMKRTMLIILVIFLTSTCVLAPPVPRVLIDIKPQSCPNPLNVASKGVLPVAIVSTDAFDATLVDPATVQLEGVAPLRWSVEDVATPFDPYSVSDGDCLGCTTEGPDGIDDLTLKFKRQEIIEALGDVYNRQCRLVRITGETFSGELIVGEDVVVILDNK